MKHHHTPKFLLKAWANYTVDEKIEAFHLDLPGLPSSRLTPKYTAYEHDLYALTQPHVAGIEQQSLETDFLQHIDNSAARVLHKLLTTGLAGLTQEDRCDWILFLMSLRQRTPDNVLLLKNEGERYLKDSLDERPEEYSAISESSDPTTLARISHHSIE